MPENPRTVGMEDSLWLNYLSLIWTKSTMRHLGQFAVCLVGWTCRFWLTYCCTALCCTLRMGALSSQRPQLPQLPANMLVAQSRCNTCLEEQHQSEPEEPISEAGGFCCGKKCMFFLARLPPPAPWNGLRPFYLLLQSQDTAAGQRRKPENLSASSVQSLLWHSRPCSQSHLSNEGPCGLRGLWAWLRPDAATQLSVQALEEQKRKMSGKLNFFCWKIKKINPLNQDRNC